jgi:hypothetical protein
VKIGDRTIINHAMQRIRLSQLDLRGTSPATASDSEPIEVLLESDPETQLRSSRPLVLAEPQVVRHGPAFQSAPDRAYDVMNLLRFDDRDFVNAAYRAILLRIPDEGGMETYLGHLRSGTPKEQILRILLDSDEGRAGGAVIGNLSKRIFWLNLLKKPVIGWVLRLAKAIYELPQADIRRRLETGRFLSLIDQIERGTSKPVSLANRAIRDLDYRSKQISSLVVAKASRNDLIRFDGVLSEIQLSIAELIQLQAHTDELIKKTLEDLEALRK